MATGLDRYFAKSLGGKLVFGFIDQNWPRLFSVQYCVTSYFEEVRSGIHCTGCPTNIVPCICLGGHV